MLLLTHRFRGAAEGEGGSEVSARMAVVRNDSCARVAETAPDVIAVRVGGRAPAAVVVPEVIAVRVRGRAPAAVVALQDGAQFNHRAWASPHPTH